MANIKIAVLNQYTALSDDAVQTVVAALQIQVHQDFAPAWGIDADLTYYPSGQTPPLDSWQLIIFDDSDQAGALGYHDLTPSGFPLGKVFAGTDKKYNSSWSVTASHELLEMLGDPDINLCALVESGNTAGTLYAYEVCDACEDDQYGYKVSVGGTDVLVSDFVLPSWFETFHPAGTLYDFQKKITQPFQLLPGGYISIFKIGSGSGWTQETAKDTLPAFKMRANTGSRRERRRTPRNQWLRSVVRKPVPAKSGAKEKVVATAATRGVARAAGTGAASTQATITIDFLQGQGSITAELFRGGAQVDQGSNTDGGSIVFNDARTNDAISVEGTCTGVQGAAITITGVNVNPSTPKSYATGTILDGFDIL